MRWRNIAAAAALATSSMARGADAQTEQETPAVEESIRDPDDADEETDASPAHDEVDEAPVSSAPEEPSDPLSRLHDDLGDDVVSEAAPEAPEAIDVTVLGERIEDDVTQADELGPRDVQRMPGAFGDAFRAIEALPGVTPLAAGLPHLLIRGAPPSASGYFLDGVEVPFLFHLGIGPSVIHPALIDDVDFHAGAYPVRYGRLVGGVVSANTREPSGRLRLEGTLRLFDVGAYAEVPFADGDLTVFGAGRYSYTAPLLSLFAEDTTLAYWDYQGGASYRLSSRDRIGVFTFGSYDHLGQINIYDEEETLFGAEFYRVQAFLERRPPDRAAEGPADASARLSITYGHDRSRFGSQAAVRNNLVVVRGEVAMPLTPWLTMRGGLDGRADLLEFESGAENDPPSELDDGRRDFSLADAFSTRDAGVVGAFVDAVVRPHRILEIVPGIRADLYAEPGTTQVGVDPRGLVRVRALPELAVVTAAGYMHQKPKLLVAVPGLEPLGLSGGLQAATQLSHGVELFLPEEIFARVTGFYHLYHDLTDVSATCSTGIKQCHITDRADGRAYGLEVMMQRSLGERVGGLVSYTLSRAERTANGETFTADFDRTHVFHFALGVDLGSRWHAGARLATFTGRPFSLLAFDDPDDPLDATRIGQRNALRRDAFWRLDLRLEKRFVIADAGWISIILEGYNVTLQKETVDFDCRVAEVLGSGALDCGGQEIGPITIPSLGIAGGI
jgi:hypothetical protein